MAGEGKRFKEAGYTIPKPLIEVDGKPMVIRALESLPRASKNILIVRKEHLNIDDFKSLLNNYFENVIIVEIDYLTEGQASTCLLSESHVPKDSIINIGACDIGFEYNMIKYKETLDKFESFQDAVLKKIDDIEEGAKASEDFIEQIAIENGGSKQTDLN